MGEHYRPLSATAPLPGTLAGGLLAVADKADNIVGAWVAGQKPSGSRDPYGLRRAAMGIVRIALEYACASRSPACSPRRSTSSRCRASTGSTTSAARVIVAETAAFVRERLQVLLLDEGLPFPSVEAALAAPAADVPALAARARTFAALAGRDFFEDAVTAYNRCAALAAKDAAAGSRAVDPALFDRRPPSASWRRPARRRAGRCSRRSRTSSSRARSKKRPACGRPSTATSTPCWSWTTTSPCAATGWRSWPRSRP